MYICLLFLLPYHFQDLLYPLLVRCPWLLGTKKFLKTIISMPSITAGVTDPIPPSRNKKYNFFSLEIWFFGSVQRDTRSVQCKASSADISCAWLPNSPCDVTRVISHSHWSTELEERMKCQIRKDSTRFAEQQLNRKSNRNKGSSEAVCKIYKFYAV